MTYSIVKDSGLPNCIGEKIFLESGLNIKAWEHHLHEAKYEKLLDGLRYGFVSGFLGPVTVMDMKYYNDNHKSVNDYPEEVDTFIANELQGGLLVGPFDSPPFEIQHCAPLMSRIKTGGEKRRIISDLKHPSEISVNSYIPNNTFLGIQKTHTLPKTDDVVAVVDMSCKDYWLSSCDLKNAYKHFKCCPSDFPLFTIKWRGKYYFECTIPFGARNSSLVMQSVANAILDILAKKNITAFMYLDDLLIISIGQAQAAKDKKITEDLLGELALKTVPHKNQGPTQKLCWIGVIFDMTNFTISVPVEKLQRLIDQIDSVINNRYITKKTMQSIIGRIMHISKCVVPSRIFSSRLLQALREENNGRIIVSTQVKHDLNWFKAFSHMWNGTAIFNSQNVIRTLFTVTLQNYIIATDMCFIYIVQLPAEHQHSQWTVEVINIALAMEVFHKELTFPGQVRICSRVKKAVAAFNLGNTRHQQIDELIRNSWFKHALENMDYRVDFSHHFPHEIITLENSVQNEHGISETLEKQGLVQLKVKQETIDKIMGYFDFRSGSPSAYDKSCSEASESQSSWYHQKYQLLCEGVPDFHLQ